MAQYRRRFFPPGMKVLRFLSTPIPYHTSSNVAIFGFSVSEMVEELGKDGPGSFLLREALSGLSVLSKGLSDWGMTTVIKRFAAGMTAGVLVLVLALTPCAAGTFGDVETEHPAFEAIEFVNQLGIMRGYGDQVFGPGDYFTREQLAAVVVRMLDLEDLIGEAQGQRAEMYEDSHLDPEYWSHPYLTVAYQEEIMVGGRVGDLRFFRPADNATFNEVWTILVRSLLRQRLENWPADYHAKVMEMGLSGQEEVEILGDSPATRAHIADLVHRALTQTEEGKSLAQELYPREIHLEWTFDETKEGWTGDFTDLPADYDEEMYDLIFEHAQLPAELGEGKALVLSGINRSDDLFMYVKRQLSGMHGIRPSTAYLLTFEVEFGTNAPAGAVGVGGPPGEAVWVKIGAAPEEPVPVEVMEAHTPFLVLNVDKGRQNEDGENAVRIGDVAKVDCEEFDVYEMKILSNEEPFRMESDEEGNLWIFVGTDSGFEGLTRLYYNWIRVVIEMAD